MKLRVLAIVGGTLIMCSSIASAALTNHPELNTAYQQVEAALKSLGQAKNGKAFFGGHREQADKLLQEALTQISKAAEYADQHPTKK